MQVPLISSLNWLRVFEVAARHQSFARAAAELNMSAAAVSQQILSLETRLGRPLFIRSANRVLLTAEGRDFLPTVQVSLGAIESKAGFLFGKQRREHVSLLASQLMAMSWLPRVLTEFRAEYPSVIVELLVEGVQRKSEPDMAIRFGEEPRLVRHPLRLMGMTHVVMCKKADVKRITSLKALLSHRLFDVPSHAVGWGALLNINFSSLDGLVPKLEAVDTTPQALSLVSQGLGLAIGHFPVCTPLTKSLGLEICPFVPKTPGPGSYFIEHALNKPQSSVALHLERSLIASAQVSMRSW